MGRAMELNIRADESNNSTNEYTDQVKVDISAVLGIYLLVLTATLVGNILVCLTIIKNKEMRSKRWYYFLMNLSVADMSFALLTPVHLVQVAGINVGTVGCKMGIHVINAVMLTSILTLTYISIDRYLCVCQPKIGYARRMQPLWVIMAIWACAIIFTSPFSVFCRRNPDPARNSCDCDTSWPSAKGYTAYKFIVVVVGFYIPFLVMLFSYSRISVHLWGRKGDRSSIQNDRSGKKKRSIKMMILATSLFFMSWFPYTVLYVVKHMEVGNPAIVGKLWLFIQLIAFSNSAWNPFTYCVYSKEFRKGFKMIFCWRKEKRSKEEGELERRNPEKLNDVSSERNSGENSSSGNISNKTEESDLG